MSLKSGLYSDLYCHGLLSSLSSSFFQMIAAVSCHGLSLIPPTQWLSFFLKKRTQSLLYIKTTLSHKIKPTLSLASKVIHSVCPLSIPNSTSPSTHSILYPCSFHVLGSHASTLLNFIMNHGISKIIMFLGLCKCFSHCLDQKKKKNSIYFKTQVKYHFVSNFFSRS